jgi:hypothetical protein
MSTYVKAADKLRERFRCAVIIIHHCGINDKRPRGHTSLTAAADAQIAVTRAGQVKATVEFMKDGEEDTEIYSKLVPVVVGHDTNGVPITSCVVEPDNGASSGMRQPKVRPLPIQQKRALELLGEAIHKAGAISPACDHIPPNVPCVSEDLWREYCYAGQIAESDKPDARRKAFGRASSELLAAGRIGKWNDRIWIVP